MHRRARFQNGRAVGATQCAAAHLCVSRPYSSRCIRSGPGSVSERAISDESSRPRLAAHRRLRYDEARKSWAIQAPERVFLLDEIAYAIVVRCDGRKTVREIVDELCAAFQA